MCKVMCKGQESRGQSGVRQSDARGMAGAVGPAGAIFLVERMVPARNLGKGLLELSRLFKPMNIEIE
jgi:hypothetical protein